MCDLHSLKQQLRQTIRQRKQQYSLQQREAWSKEIEQMLLSHPRMQAARVVMLYYALPDEVDTRHLADTLLHEGKTVVLPKCVDKIHIEPRQYTGPDDLAEGIYNLLEPVGKPYDALGDIELIIVPGMSFDEQGHRLGRGRGYYDRFLAQVPQAYKIGVCFDFQRMEQVPVDENDQVMDEVLSNKPFSSQGQEQQ